MSLTSYRAAPPRDNHCAPSSKAVSERLKANALERVVQSVLKLPEKATPGQSPEECGRYVPTQTRFGKGIGGVFAILRQADSSKTDQIGRSLPDLREKPPGSAKFQSG